jgi:SAM-dependent methyltransferase
VATTTGNDRTPAGDAVAHYESLLEQHGAVPTGVGWNSEHAQHERFAQLAAILPNDDVPLSVLDFGCGFGSFAEFLADGGTAPGRRLLSRRDAGVPLNFTYVGYDASSSMIARARERVHDPRVRFEEDWNRVPQCDYAVASGIFNVRGTWTDERWWAYIQETLRAIHDRVTAGWSANFLTSYSDAEKMRPELYYADPLVVFDWCKRHLSRFVALHHDYPLYDFTILVRKESR